MATGSDAKPTAWEVLSRVDVSEKIEKKNGMSYLSWAWAWGKLKEFYPAATFVKHCRADGLPYFMDMQGYAFVKVTVSLNNEGKDEATETFPILDHRNKPIQGPSAFDVNNALQRCLTKAIAYLGLGHYIYAGEDLPEESVAAPVERTSSAPAPTPAPASTPASTAPASASGGVPVVGLDGSIEGHQGAETVAAVFTAFIPLCTDEKMLGKFYTTNKTAIAYLQTTNVDLHKSVMDAFAARKAALKSSVKEGAN